MKNKIFRLDSDLMTKYDIISGLRSRNLPQKFIYYGDGANSYISYVKDVFLKGGNRGNKKLNINPWKNIINSLNLNKEKHQIYIGVACGDSSREIAFLKNLKNKNIKYIGIDSSEEMIEVSDALLKKENIDYNLIRADIFNPDLIGYINSLIGLNHEKSFLFLGGTFGNFNTTNITDLISSFMKKDEKLYIDLFHKDSSAESDFAIHEHYLEKIRNDDLWNKHSMSGFTHIKFPVEKGKVTLHTKKDNQVGLFGVKFYLQLNENIEYILNKRSIIFSKGEEILFHQVIYYEIEKLAKFMKLHHFNLIEEDLDNGALGQFLFEKE